MKIINYICSILAFGTVLNLEAIKRPLTSYKPNRNVVVDQLSSQKKAYTTKRSQKMKRMPSEHNYETKSVARGTLKTPRDHNNMKAFKQLQQRQVQQTAPAIPAAASIPAAPYVCVLAAPCVCVPVTPDISAALGIPAASGVPAAPPLPIQDLNAIPLAPLPAGNNDQEQQQLQPYEDATVNIPPAPPLPIQDLNAIPLAPLPAGNNDQEQQQLQSREGATVNIPHLNANPNLLAEIRERGQARLRNNQGKWNVNGSQLLEIRALARKPQGGDSNVQAELAKIAEPHNNLQAVRAVYEELCRNLQADNNNNREGLTNRPARHYQHPNLHANPDLLAGIGEAKARLRNNQGRGNVNGSQLLEIRALALGPQGGEANVEAALEKIAARYNNLQAVRAMYRELRRNPQAWRQHNSNNNNVRQIPTFADLRRIYEHNRDHPQDQWPTKDLGNLAVGEADRIAKEASKADGRPSPTEYSAILGHHGCSNVVFAAAKYQSLLVNPPDDDDDEEEDSDLDD